jgi:glycogen debranching enzyme
MPDLREWLDTNGLGGFACGTVSGIHTRRYHGLLTAATHPPAGRHLLLSKIEETITVNGESYELGANQYPDLIHPRGFRYLVDFRLSPWPTWTYRTGTAYVTKSICLVDGENTLVVRYEIEGPDDVTLELRPLIAFRDYHATTHENITINTGFTVEDGVVRIEPYEGLPPLYFAMGAGEVRAMGHWYRSFRYALEEERGLEAQEDLFQPFAITGARELVISTQPPAETAGALCAREKTRREALGGGLARAADQFFVRRGAGWSVIAGYPWFADWGRDTMIALPGLAAATGRFDVARGVLLEFSRHVDEGMLPNRFVEAGEAPEYNTVDATLWFFETAAWYERATGDRTLVDEDLYPVLAAIIDWHRRGTRYGIRVDADGLLHAGAPGWQLTWMDARANGHVVTPREGKPVEIQALWYNALCLMRDWTVRRGGTGEYGEWAERARAALGQFFNAHTGCLFDVIGVWGRDPAIRPNQLFALSLTHPILDPAADAAKSLLEVVRRDLLTPFGLRTLAPSDPRYVGRYAGPPHERDAAYHQGTVWPWLLGAYATAWRRVFGADPDEWSSAIERYRMEQGFGHVPEIFDGDAPHRARGCFAQAWSLAAISQRD